MSIYVGMSSVFINEGSGINNLRRVFDHGIDDSEDVSGVRDLSVFALVSCDLECPIEARKNKAFEAPAVEKAPALNVACWSFSFPISTPELQTRDDTMILIMISLILLSRI